jgi:hypothetical protein
MIQALAYNVKNTLQQNLEYILSQTYIIRELLEDLPQKVVDDFINKYAVSVDKKPVVPISVNFGYPQDLQSTTALVSVTSGNGQEETNSIGFVEGTYEGKGYITKERIEINGFEIKEGLEYAVATTKKEILRVDTISEIASDYITYEGNKVYIQVSNVFEHGTFTIGDSFTCMYYQKVNEKVGASIGYVAREEVLISVVSNNMDTIVCLDMLVKVCIITMRESLRDKMMTDLPKISHTPIAPIDPELIPGTPNIIYNRDYSLVYTVTNTIDKNNTKFLKGIIIQKPQLEE